MRPARILMTDWRLSLGWQAGCCLLDRWWPLIPVAAHVPMRFLAGHRRAVPIGVFAATSAMQGQTCTQIANRRFALTHTTDDC